MATKRVKKSENGAKEASLRTNVILDPVMNSRAQALMEEEKRSFNNLVNFLIDREWKRLQETKAVAA